MKIVHLCLSAFFIDNYSYQENILPKYHVRMGYDVTVIASLFTFNEKGKGCYLSGPTEYNSSNGFHIIRLAYKKPTRINRVLRKYEGLYQALIKEKPDVIFSHNVSYADTSILTKYLREKPDVKLFADNHGDFINSAKNPLSKYILHPIIWRHFAKVLEPYLIKCFGVTPMRCRFLKDTYHINPDLIGFLPMGVDDEAIPQNRAEITDNVRRNLELRSEDRLIFTGGKIDLLKNTHVLLSALKQINDKHLHLVICGTITPEMVYLRSEIELMPNVHYMGWCNASQVMNHMVASDIACFPGTHSTLWEQSVGVGLPGIFKHWHEMEHVNIDGNCTFVKGDNTNELAMAIINTFANYNEFKERSLAASKSFLYSNISKQAIGL